MKPHFIRRNSNLFKESFSIKKDSAPHFSKLWHYHEELELVYIEKSSGTRFIGDSIEPFSAGELVLLGDNLPHKWQNDQKYFDDNAGLSAEAIVVHFDEDFMGSALDCVSELKPLRSLIDRAKRGILFRGTAQHSIPPLLQQMTKMESGFERLLTLTRILKLLADENDFDYITSLGYIDKFSEKDDRLSRVYNYVMNHFQQPIQLDQVAEIANMNKSAFCRYFKRASDKSFSQYLNEIRIGYACKLLVEQERKAISEICYECGFNNLSNFNQQFKKIRGLSPSSYLAKYSEKPVHAANA